MNWRANPDSPIACIGGANLDWRGALRGPLVLGTSNPGDAHLDVGGVARNVAENLARLGSKVTLISRVGDDAGGRQVLEHSEALGIDTSWIGVSSTLPTASYLAILESSGELVVGLDDMDVYEELTPEILQPALPCLQQHTGWFVDSNVPGPTIEWLLASAGGIPVAVDAISVMRARRLIPLLPGITLLFANLVQAAVITGVPSFSDTREAARALEGMGARAGIVTAGGAGIAVWSGSSIDTLPALPARPRDVTGAGDALVAGTLWGLMRGRNLVQASQLGLAAAAITVESPHAAAPELTLTLLEERCARR
ncbi:MAG TPA: carbohydrate kinase family protein [Bryobacteraceae bacterium]|jgi:pseudouridine kinase